MLTTTFREGDNGYTGTLDTWVRAASPNTANGSSTTLTTDLSDGSGEVQALLRFDGLFGSGPGQIPLNATITSATLTLTTTNASTVGATLYRLTTDWNESSTWNSLVGGISGSEITSPGDLTTGKVTTGTRALDVTTSVQAWLSDPTSNHGWLFDALSNDGWDFASSENSTLAARPMLSVTYTVSDNNPPLAGNDSAGTVEDTALVVDWSALLANDSDPDGEPLTINAVGSAAHGTVQLNPTANTITYTPTANYSGSDSFTYTVSDGAGGTATATVSVAVNAVDDAPSGADKAISLQPGATYSFTAADFGFSDVDGNQLLAVKITTLPSSGTLTLNGAAVTAGEFVAATSIPQLAYAAGSSNGAFTFQVQDDGGSTNLDPTPNTISLSVLTSGPATLNLAGPITQAEGNSGSTLLLFTVNRTGDTAGTSSASYAVSNGPWGTGYGLTAAADFSGGVLPSGTVTFNPGETSKQIAISVVGNSTFELSERFTLTLSNPSAGTQLDTASAIGAILNDDNDGIVRNVLVYDGRAYATGGQAFGSTDPSGVTYDPATHTIYMTDSEVNETPFNGTKNLFAINLDGTLKQAYSTLSYTAEPTGVGWWMDPSTGVTRLFISDDDQNLIFSVDPANPSVKLSQFSTAGLVSDGDPEDVKIDPRTGHLYLADEEGHRIVETTQTGQWIDSIPMPSAIREPEGLAYDPSDDTFYLVGYKSSSIFHIDRDGTLLETISTLSKFPNTTNGKRVVPKGIEIAPSSDDPSQMSLWVSDYGRDQVNDGRLFEVMLDRAYTDWGII